MNLPTAERRRLEQVYNYIIRYKLSHDGNSPSYRQIAEACDISSTSQVSLTIDRLRTAGRLQCTYDKGERISGFIIPGGLWQFSVPKPER